MGRVTITNRAGGLIQSADADAIRPGTNATVNNYGTIIGNTSGDSGNDGVGFGATGTGKVNNYSGGSITGARHGITGDLPVAIYNEASITGQNGSGLNFDTASTTTMSVENHGTITGNAVSQDGDGIDVDGLITLNNYGTVKALGTVNGEINEALAIGGGAVNNYAGGVLTSVQRAITVDDSNLGNAFGATAIYNEGTIEGDDGEAIRITSTFANTVTNKGAIIGSVTLGAGADTLTLYTGSSISGAIDGRGGGDAIHLVGAGTGSLGDVANFATLGVDSGTWTLNGTQNYSGGATVAGGATASVSGTINGAITNDGTVKVSGTSATFNGAFINNGAYKSDPSTQTFTDLTNSSVGYIHAAPGDLYKVSGDFLNHSTENALWDTSGATLEFIGASSHTMALAGADLGPAFFNFADNFSWSALVLDPGDTLALEDGAAPPGGAFYVDTLTGLDLSCGFVCNIFGNGFNIYYDPREAANAYLRGRNYDLEGEGRLIAGRVPEPLSAAIILPGLGVFYYRRRRKDSR